MSEYLYLLPTWFSFHSPSLHPTTSHLHHSACTLTVPHLQLNKTQRTLIEASNQSKQARFCEPQLHSNIQDVSSFKSQARPHRKNITQKQCTSSRPFSSRQDIVNNKKLTKHVPPSSMPSATLTTLPPEMVGEITRHLSPITHAALRLVCRDLHAKMRPAPPLNGGDWYQFHHDFEAGARRTKVPIKLACRSCKKFLPTTSYQDSQAKRRCDRAGGRLCLRCALWEGEYNARNFLYQKKCCFHCIACSEPKEAKEEADYLRFVPELPLGRNSMYHAPRGKRKWCKNCWRVVTLYYNVSQEMMGGMR